MAFKPKRLSLATAIGRTAAWDCVVDEVTGATSYRSLDTVFESHGLYTRAEFHALHPALPELLDYLQARSSDGVRLPKNIMADSYAFWTTLAIALPKTAILAQADAEDAQTELRCHSQAALILARIFLLCPLAENKTTLVATAHTLYAAALPCGEAVVIDKQHCRFILDTAWLDSHLAGWQERIAVAEALELNVYETAEYCLQPLALNSSRHSVVPGEISAELLPMEEFSG